LLLFIAIGWMLRSKEQPNGRLLLGSRGEHSLFSFPKPALSSPRSHDDTK
jgi:hypothetical protein